MHIGFVINSLASEDHRYTTVRLAYTANRMGHEAWLIPVDALAADPDGTIQARAHAADGKRFRSQESYLAHVRSDEGRHERVCVDGLDVLFLRNDPAADAGDRPWAQTSGILFGQLAARRGVLVVNDPEHLANALNKTYFQHFPEAVRPRTLITRDRDEIAAFVDELEGRAVLKPLQGSGGQGVFLVADEESPNLNQIVEAISRDGYVVAQEYLTAAEQGDVRIFVMNGRPLQVDGKYAAFRRVNHGSDMRSNMHAGGEAEPVKMDDELLGLVELVRPKLLEDGMFLVGLDVVGDKLMEVNVFSPGGLTTCTAMYEAAFDVAILDSLAAKVEHRRHYGETLTNAALATL